MSTLTARQEWAAKWPQPLIGMLGVSGCAIFTYSSGVFVEDITRELGWTRTEFASAFVLQMAAGLLILPVTGWLSDRYGARRILLIGIVPFALSLGLLGQVGQPLWQWWAFCLISALAQGFITQPIWVAAVIGHFKASRGLAMAFALSGLGLASLAWPLLAALYVGPLGWRLAFPAIGLTWAVVMLPLTIFVFRNPPKPASVARTKVTVSDYMGAIRTRTFIGLMIAGGLFASSCYGITVNLVPTLKAEGLGLTAAALVAGSQGIATIFGRLLMGHLLDRLPTRPLAIVVFLLPGLAALILLNVDGSMAMAVAGAIVLGFAGGAEMDIVTFVAAQRFSRQIFGSIYAMFVAILALVTSLGTLVAGMSYDHFQSYDAYLMMVPFAVAVAAAVMATIPTAPVGTGEGEGEDALTGQATSEAVA